MKIRTSLSRRPRKPVDLSKGGDVQVKQEFKKEADINHIMRRLKSGHPPAWMNPNSPRYGDFTNMPATLQEAYDLVQRAEDAFESLPVEFRNAIDHDPRNIEKAPRELWEKHGLLKPSLDERAGTPDVSDAPARQRGKGDRDLPVTARPGRSNKDVKSANVASDEDGEQ